MSLPLESNYTNITNEKISSTAKHSIIHFSLKHLVNV